MSLYLFSAINYSYYHSKNGIIDIYKMLEKLVLVTLITLFSVESFCSYKPN